MEKREKRTTTMFAKTATGEIGPAEYDAMKYSPKESFNYGSVPFGSHTNQQFLY